MTATDPDGERDLVDAARQGDRRAIEQLLRAHQPTVYAVCRRIIGNDADALDATQEALISVVRGVGRFDGRSRFSTWCYRIATNAALDELRRRARRPALSLVDRDREDASAEPVDAASAEDIERVADRVELDDALAQLPVEFRTAVVLRDLCQLDYAEIAEVLEIPPGTVRSRIARGRGQLATLLSGNPTTPDERPTTAP